MAAPELTEAEVRRAIDGHFGLRLKDDGWICCGCLEVVAPDSADLQDAREGLYAHRAGKVWSLFKPTRKVWGVRVDAPDGRAGHVYHEAQDREEAAWLAGLAPAEAQAAVVARHRTEWAEEPRG